MAEKIIDAVGRVRSVTGFNPHHTGEWLKSYKGAGGPLGDVVSILIILANG
jgi:hypothetical protein